MTLSKDDVQALKEHLLKNFGDQGVSLGVIAPRASEFRVVVRLTEGVPEDINENIMASARDFVQKHLGKKLDDTEVDIARVGRIGLY